MGDEGARDQIRQALLDDAIRRAMLDDDIVVAARGYARLDEVAEVVVATLEDPWRDMDDLLDRYEAVRNDYLAADARLRDELVLRGTAEEPVRPSGLRRAVSGDDVAFGLAGTLLALVGATQNVAAIVVAGVGVLAGVGVSAARAALRTSWDVRRLHMLVDPPDVERTQADVAELAARLAALEATVVDVLCERTILPAFRSEIAARREPSYALTLPAGDAPGLAQELPPDFQLQNEPARQVTRLLALPSANIGVAGPRGSGKTTLIDSFCRTDEGSGRLAVKCDAPVDYQARDFLLHLYARLCTEVVAVFGPGAPARTPSPSDDAPDQKPEWWRPAIAVACAAVVAGATVAVDAVAPSGYSRHMAGGAALLLLGLSASAAGRVRGLWPRRVRVPIRYAAAVIVAGGAVLLAVALVDRSPAPGFGWGIAATVVGTAFLAAAQGRAAVEAAEERSRPSPTRAARLSENAADLLRRIRFQQSFTTGWSGKVGISGAGVGAELGRNESRTWAAQPWTLPDVVEGVRKLLEEVAEDRQVVVGVDELDKIADEAAAGRFVDDIKGVFGGRNRYFLVAVSEDAMASFERRGLPFRNAFDSAFSDIVHVPYSTFEDTRKLLESRVVGMPLPFVGLCHTLAGGLPRDVIRVARKLHEPHRPIAMRWAAEFLVGEEVAGKARAVAAAAAVIAAEPLAREVVKLADPDQLPAREPDVLLARCCRLLDLVDALPPDAEEGPARLGRLAEELASFLYFAATVVEFFGDDSVVDVIEQASLDPYGEHWFLRLAAARQAFAVHPVLARTRIDEFRAAAGLERLARGKPKLRRNPAVQRPDSYATSRGGGAR